MMRDMRQVGRKAVLDMHKAQSHCKRPSMARWL